MKKKYHLLVNEIVLAILAYFICRNTDELYLIIFIISPLSAIFPDFDVGLMKVGILTHRDILFHSFVFPAAAVIGSFFFDSSIAILACSCFSIGYGVHLLCDFCPKFKLSGFGLIHVFSDAKSESWSLRWLTLGFIISTAMGIAGILIILL